jgi:AcrR family transcriptional regulator
VVEAAAVMADETGLGGIVLAGLAERVGVRQPSLYKHIDSLAGLRRGVSVAAQRQLLEVLTRAAVGRSGREALVAMARAYRGWALEHPGRYEAAQLMPAPDDAEHEASAAAIVDLIADVLSAYGLRDDDDAVDAIRGFRAMLHGFVSLESAGGFRLRADVDRSFDRLIEGFALTLEQGAGGRPA